MTPTPTACSTSTPATAQSVSLPAAVCGICEKTEDVDCYRFDGTEGQELTFNVYAQRVTTAVHSMQSGNGTYLMDALMTLYGPHGQIIAQNDGQAQTPNDVDQLVERHFLSPESRKDEYNLKFVRDRLTGEPGKNRELLHLYRDILKGKTIADNTLSPVHSSTC